MFAKFITATSQVTNMKKKREKTENSMEKQLLAKSSQRSYKPYLVNYKCSSRHITAVKDWVSLNPEPSVLIC